jgi:hypothetical protein
MKKNSTLFLDFTKILTYRTDYVQNQHHLHINERIHFLGVDVTSSFYKTKREVQQCYAYLQDICACTYSKECNMGYPKIHCHGKITAQQGLVEQIWSLLC